MTLQRGKPLARSTKPIRQVSEKKAALDAELDVARAVRRDRARGLCEGPTPDCVTQGAHAGVLAHHTRRRKGQPDVHDPDHLRWLCWDAHEWVHANITAARAVGLLA